MTENAETTSAEAPEPGGWLAAYQRAHCRGLSAIDTYQGVLSDEIVLPEVAANDADPLQLVLATEAFADALLNQACFLPGEFAPEALWSFRVYEYWSQVKAGGHEQYFANHGRDEIALRCCRAGLKSMLADPHLEIFDLLLSLKRAEPRVAGKLAAQAGYKSVATALRDLDRRFAQVEEKEPLTPRHKIWLKSLRKVKFVPAADMDQHLNRIASANRLWRQRKQETDFLRDVSERDDPAHRAAKSLCEAAGLRFAGVRAGGFTPLRAVWAEGPKLNAYACRVETDRGPRTALFYVEGSVFSRRRVATLVEQGVGSPLASLPLSASEYEAIVPDEQSQPKVRD